MSRTDSSCSYPCTSNPRLISHEDPAFVPCFDPLTTLPRHLIPFFYLPTNREWERQSYDGTKPAIEGGSGDGRFKTLVKKPLPILLCMTGDSMTSRFNRIGVGKLKLNSKEELIRPETTAEAK